MNNNITVLVVEDEKPMRDTIKYHVRKMGFERVIEADDGATALQRLLVDNVGLILSDWNMPDMDGLELLKNVRANAALHGIPFLMITANKEKGNVIQALKEGVNHYIVKPFDGKTLKNKIREILEEAN